MKTVGVIGVGRMGHGIAANLLRHGWPLVFLDHPGNQPTGDLEAAGARRVGRIADIAAQCGTVILVVTGAPQVEAVLAGPDGLLDSLRPDTVIIDCSTSLPETTKAMAAKVAQAGGLFLDAPMTRTPKEAAEGRLNLIVGGDAALLEAQRPMLDCFAENIVHAGGTGSGHALKLLHNFVSLGFAAVLNEAAAAARESGVALDVFCDVLAKGGGRSVALDRLAPAFTEGDTSGFNFTIANAAKDLGYYLDMTGALGLEPEAAEALAEVYSSRERKGQGDRLVSEMVEPRADLRS